MRTLIAAVVLGAIGCATGQAQQASQDRPPCLDRYVADKAESHRLFASSVDAKQTGLRCLDSMRAQMAAHDMAGAEVTMRGCDAWADQGRALEIQARVADDAVATDVDTCAALGVRIDN